MLEVEWGRTRREGGRLLEFSSYCQPLTDGNCVMKNAESLALYKLQLTASKHKYIAGFYTGNISVLIQMK